MATQAEAENLATQAVTLELARCVNIIPQALSIYKWEGHIEKTTECLLLFKTSVDKQEALKDWIQTHYPYEVPALLSSPLKSTDAFSAFINDA